jgi:hypothetical protein
VLPTGSEKLSRRPCGDTTAVTERPARSWRSALRPASDAGEVGERLGVVDAQAVEHRLQRVAGLDAFVVDEGQRGVGAGARDRRCGQGLDDALDEQVRRQAAGCDRGRGDHPEHGNPGDTGGNPGSRAGEETSRQIG